MGDPRDELRERAKDDGIEFFFAMFVDMHGKPCAKLIPAAAYDEVLMGGGAGFAGFAAGPMGQSPADPDMIAMPDPASYAPAPWQPGLAVLQCDIHVDGGPWPYAPRVILKRQLEKLAARNLTLNAGFEAEYFLVQRRSGPEGGIALADPLDTAAAPCYDAKALSRMYEHLTTVSRYMNQLGWSNYANDHEDANGQFEQNFKYADALTSADRLIFFRYMVHTLAHLAGMAATFMPKPFANLTGNGLHIHSSLWDAASGDELFADPSDPRGLGLSKTAYAYIGGLIDHAPATIAVTCPTVNSYKRMGVGAPKSGATWAPAYATYGGNNRAVDPGEPNLDNLYTLSEEQVRERGITAMPPTLLHAADNLVADPIVREALGKIPGGDYADYYASVKREEFHDYHAVVSPWEVDRYLTLF